MNKTIRAIRYKVQLAIQRIGLNRNKLEKEMEVIRNTLQEKEKNLHSMKLFSTTIHPELEIMRREYMQKIFHSMAVMENNLGELQQQKEKLQCQEIKLKKQIRIIDKYCEKKLKDGKILKQRRLNNTLDEWAIQRRESYEY